MNIVKFKTYLSVMLIVVLLLQGVHANEKNYETIYENNTAYAMENTYISEEIRFEVPYALTKYNVTKTKDGGYLFVHIDGDRVSVVKYDGKGNLVFGDPLDPDNYVAVTDEGKVVTVLRNQYNLIDISEYNLNNVPVTFDDEYFYLPVVVEDEKYTLSMIRFNLNDGTPDYSFKEDLFEIEKESCFSFGAVYAWEDVNNATVVINIDRYVYEEEEVVSLLHEIYLVSLGEECNLVYSEEVAIEELNDGDLVREDVVSHLALSYGNYVYFVEGVTYREYNKEEYAIECIVYKLGEDVVKASINDLANENHTLENGEYYSVNLLPTEKGLGCILNYWDVQSDTDSIYTYYSAIASLSYEDLSNQFVVYYPESEQVEKDGVEMLKYQNYLDLLSINNDLTILWEYREPSDDVIFLGNLQTITFAILDEEGNVKDKLELQGQLGNAEVMYGNVGISNKLFLFDNIPEYDRYTEVLPEDTRVSFVALGYGLAYMVTGLDSIEVETDVDVDVINGVAIKNALGEEVLDNISVEFEGQVLKDNKFSHSKEGEYEVTIVVLGDDGREFRVSRKISVYAPNVVNPPTGNSCIITYSILILAFLLVLCKTERRKHV